MNCGIRFHAMESSVRVDNGSGQERFSLPAPALGRKAIQSMEEEQEVERKRKDLRSPIS